MCGICGIIENDKNNTDIVSQMLDIIQHRGPDGKSIFQHQNFILGHRRLAIIDLHTGAQPIFNEDKTIAVVFNGEIYNFQEIKNKLIQKGHRFYTNTDTEILVHLYEDEGDEFMLQLNGIFAFALLDIKRNRLLLSRDHFGVKPLHYFFRDNLFIFGSEQKSILLHPKVGRSINFNALHSHINLRYTQMNETLFSGIKRLPPAHYLIWENNSINIKRYWQLKPEINFGLQENVAIEKLHFLLKQAVKRQLISDVPIGVYLSGGMDSSTLVQKMHELEVPEINTFTLGFNEPTDEFEDAGRIASYFNTNHRTHSLALNAMNDFPAVIWHAEEPKINLLQGYNLSAFVQNHVKVVLGGVGGDELFAGYDIHKFIYPFNDVFNSLPKFIKQLLRWKSNFIFKIQNFTNTLRFDEYRRGMQMLLAIGEIERFYLILRNVWDFDNDLYKQIYHKEFYNKILGEQFKVKKEFENFFKISEKTTALDKVLFTEFHTKMVNDYLLTEDRMSMSHSVEQRVPFLDIDLVNFGFSIPIDLKIKNRQTKYLFRKAMLQKLPQDIITKKKWGFTINPYLQFKKDLKNISEQILTKEFIEAQGIFNHNYLKKIINHPPNKNLRWHYNFLWIVLGIAIWQKMFIETNDFQNKQINLDNYK